MDLIVEAYEQQKKKNLKGIDFLDLLEKYYPTKNQKRNPMAYKAKVIYDLYLSGYKNKEFNNYFNEWFNKSHNLKLLNIQCCDSIFKILFQGSNCNYQYVDIKTLNDISKKLDTDHERIKKIRNPIIKDVSTSFNNLISVIESLSNDIRKTNK